MKEKYLQSQQRGGLNDLTVNSERHSHEIHSIEEFSKRDSANSRKVQAPDAMKEQEADKVLIIFFTDTLSDPELKKNLPNAMVIEFGYAHFADGTVFRTGGFKDVAGFALVVFLVDDLVVVRFVFFGLFFGILCGDFTWGDWAGFVVDPETDNREEVSEDDMEVADLGVGHVLEDAEDLIRDESTWGRMVPANCDDEVENLDDGMIALHEIGLDTAQTWEGALAEDFWDEVAALLCWY